MSQLTQAQFKALYGSSGTQFPDNTTEIITELIMRTFGENSADSLLFLQTNRLDRQSISTAGSTITFDFDSRRDRIFYGSASFSTTKTIALSNSTNAVRLCFIFQITDVAAVLTFPSSFLMSDPRWNDSTYEWTAVEAGKYKAEAKYDGTNWYIDITGPYNIIT